MWHSFGDVDAYRHKAEVLARHCQAVGRDPAEIERTWGVHADLLQRADGLRAAGVISTSSSASAATATATTSAGCGAVSLARRPRVVRVDTG